MRLRTFTAPDMPTALKMVRDAMGEDAVILSSEPQKGRKGITVTAALDGGDDPIFPTTSKAISSTSAENIRHELQQVLRFHNVPDMLITKIFNRADPRELASIEALHQMGARRDQTPFIKLALEKTLGSYFTFQPLDFEGMAKTILLTGPPGIGKTLTIAKLAARLSIAKQPITVITCDTKRAGGVEQLQAFTHILNLELVIASSPDELARALRAAPQDHHVLIDTAGCNPYDRDEMKEIAQLAQSGGIEPVLVLPAGGDSLEAIDLVEPFMVMPIKRMLITRADTARRYGGVVSAAAAHKLAFSNLSNSSSIIDTLQPVDAAQLTQLLLRYQLQST